MTTDPSLSPLERRVLAELLEDASTEFRDHSGNDYFLPANNANRALVARVIAQAQAEFGDSSLKEVTESGGQLFVFDDWLMHFLAARSASGDRLDQGELLAVRDLLASLARDDYNLYDPAEPQGRYQLDEGAEHLAFAKRAVRGYAGKLTHDEAGFIGVPTLALFAFLGTRCAEAAAAGGSAPLEGSLAAAAVQGPGINEKWRKQLKRSMNFAAQWFETQEPDTREDMRFYVQHGYSKTDARCASSMGEPVAVSFLASSSGAALFGKIHQARWEKSLVMRRQVDSACAANVFEGAWLEQHVVLRMLYLRSLKEPIRQPNWNGKEICEAAFGLVATTRTEDALQLARLQIEAVRRGFNAPSFHGPSTRFMYRLLADYLGVEPVAMRGDQEKLKKSEVACDPWFDQLFALWREPDPARIAVPALAGCDAHTHHAFSDADDWRREFDGTVFCRTPIAVLLLWRLREQLGLANPRLDHPMMEDMRPLLAADRRKPAEPDADLKAVRARMEADGFDARAIRADMGVDAQAHTQRSRVPGR